MASKYYGGILIEGINIRWWSDLVYNSTVSIIYMSRSDEEWLHLVTTLSVYGLRWLVVGTGYDFPWLKKGGH